MSYASRQSSYLIAAPGSFLQAAALWFENYSAPMLITGIAWDSAHVVLYLGLAVAALGACQGLVGHRERRTISPSPFRFVNTIGLKLTCLGCPIEVLGIVWRGIVACNLGCEAGDAVSYTLLIFGILAANLGIVLGLTIEYGLIKREFIIVSSVRRATVIIFIMLAFSAIWLAGSGALIHLAQALRSTFENWVVAFCLALFGTFVLVPLKRVLPGIGSGLGVSIVFNTVVYLGFIFQGSSQRLLPWGLLPVILFELALWRLLKAVGIKRAALLASLVMGLFFAEAYYPFTASLFPWSFFFRPQLLWPLVGSVAGAYLGNRLFSALSSAVLSEVTAML